MRALVTGGAGFIGSHLVRGLLDRGHQVSVIDDFSSGSADNLANLAEGLRVYEGSILDEATMRQAADGVAAVFHLAAIASVPRSIDDPSGTYRVNVEGTRQVFEAALRTGAKVIFSGSSAIYGDTPNLPIQETEPPRTLSPYAEHKLTAEQELRALHDDSGLRGVALRYFNVYGPRQNPHSEYAAVVPKFVTRALENRPLIIYGDGGQTRDFVYVEDVVRANLVAFESEIDDGRPYNIGAGRSITIRELAETVVSSLGSCSPIEHQPARSGEVRLSEADVRRAREGLGFEAAVSLEEGLRRTADHWRTGA